MKFVFLTVGGAVFLVFVWALVMMMIAGLKDRDHRSLGWFFSGLVVQTDYNRKRLWIAAGCMFFLVMWVIAFNVLVYAGLLDL